MRFWMQTLILRLYLAGSVSVELRWFVKITQLLIS